MFVLWRMVQMAETAYFRRLAGFSSIRLNDSKHLDVLKKGELLKSINRPSQRKCDIELFIQVNFQRLNEMDSIFLSYRAVKYPTKCAGNGIQNCHQPNTNFK